MKQKSNSDVFMNGNIPFDFYQKKANFTDIAMWDQLTDEAFLKPASAVLALLLFLLLLKKVNKILLFVGIAVVTTLYLMYNQPEWLKAIISSFQI